MEDTLKLAKSHKANKKQGETLRSRDLAKRSKS